MLQRVPAPGTALRPPRNLRGTPGEVVLSSGRALHCPPGGGSPGRAGGEERGRDAVPVRRLSMPPDTGPRIAGVPAVGAEWCWRSRLAPLAPKGSQHQGLSAVFAVLRVSFSFIYFLELPLKFIIRKFQSSSEWYPCVLGKKPAVY